MYVCIWHNAAPIHELRPTVFKAVIGLRDAVAIRARYQTRIQDYMRSLICADNQA
jgi:hypothetical protein